LGRLVNTKHRQPEAVQVRRDMARPAAEVSDYSRRPASDHLSEGGEQGALGRPVIQ